MDSQAKSKLFTGVKTLQKLIFMHPAEGETFSKRLILKQCLVWLVSTLPIIVGVHGYAYNVYSVRLYQEVCESVYYSTVLFGTWMLITIYMFVGNRFWRAIQRIGSNAFGVPQSLVANQKKLDKIVCVIFFAVLIVDLISSIHAYKTNNFCVVQQMLNDKRYRCGFHTSVWYPFEEDKYIKDWILKLWLALGQDTVFPIHAITIMFLVGTLNFITERLRHLRSIVEQIDEENLQELLYIAKYYIEILECGKEMNNSLGYFLTGGYLSVSMILSLSGYVSILGHRYSEGILLIGTYAILLVLCRFGQDWQNEHEKLMRSVCNLSWHKMTPKMRKNYHLLLGTVQIPIRVLGRPLVIFNHNLLLTVTRTTYSVLTFLAQTTD